MKDGTSAGGHTPRPASSTFLLDRSLETLAARAPAWSALPIADRIEYLRDLLRRTGERGPELVRAAVAAKGGDGRLAGEDWVLGVFIQAHALRTLLGTLEQVEAEGRVVFPRSAVSTRADGQVVLRVMPGEVWERILFPGWRGEVWLDPEVDLDCLDDHLGSFYTKPGDPEPGVAAVLGAGNVDSIAPLDVVHKMFVDGRTAAVKFSPVNDYVGPFFERVFADLIEDGFVRTAYGDAETGGYLVHHPRVNEVHLTGSAATFDTIVFGPGEEGAVRKACNDPLLTCKVTSELGNVGPLIVVPGAWRERDLRFQAEHVATQIKHNDGYNCNAARVLILHEAWDQKGEFLDHLRRVLGSLPARWAYYPGAEERWGAFVDSHPRSELIGPMGHRVLPTVLLVGLDPAADHPAFSEEAFCPAAAVVELPGTDAGDFLERAVAFGNDRLYGKLNVTVLIDPAARREMGDRFDAALAALDYGSVGVNVWSAAGYALGTMAWGGAPGATLADVQSGIGFVHNGRLIDRPVRSVMWAPFRQFPKPPWLLTHRNTVRALRRLAEFQTDPGLVRLARAATASLFS